MSYWFGGATLAVFVVGYLSLFGGAAASQLMANQACTDRVHQGIKVWRSEVTSPECQAAAIQGKVTEAAVRSVLGK